LPLLHEIPEPECADEYNPDGEGTTESKVHEASINSDGHLVVGSDKFVGGLRTKELAKLEG
jgi:hypothetical protein